ncbi:MAG: hypothetical protein HC866_04610 [Leptolyngbyaceae cyanobacterium RU_5_1]|nr:hypothetical protein [Leptolyngbyaceae cyanobacterium RU_5_1]
MATAATKRPKASVVKQAAIEHTSTFLQALPEKPKEDLSLKEAIGQLQDPIRAALAKGYTYQELAALLSEKGIRISAFTLKNYVPSGRRKPKDPNAKTGTRKGGRTKADKVVAAEPSVQAPEPVAAKTDTLPGKASRSESTREKAAEVAEAPAKPGGRKTAAKKTGSEATVQQTATRRRTTAAKESAPAKSSHEKAAKSTTRSASTGRRRKAGA